MITSSPLQEKDTVFREKWAVVVAAVFYTCLVLYSANNGFFWDTIVQGSQNASWFYSTSFEHLYLPERMDVGYQPAFGLVLALVWKVFGRTLVVSHLFMLPFLTGIIWQSWLLVRRYIPAPATGVGLLLLLLEPTLLAQATLVSSDVVMVFLYLLGLNLILKSNRLALTVILLLLGMLHLRGTVAVAALFFTEVLLNLLSSRRITFSDFVKLGLPYVPATVAVLLWFYGHYLHTGWLLQSTDPNWPYHSGRKAADVPFMLRNVVIIGWRLTDFGRIAVWGVAIASTMLLVRTSGQGKLIAGKPAAQQLLVFWLVPLVLYSLSFIGYTNPIGHRYLLVVYLLFMLFTLYLVLQLPWARVRQAFMAAIAVALVAGHFVVLLYPDHLSKGWDATLAYFPYNNLKKQVLDFLQEEQIPLAAVGAKYPDLHPQELIYLKESGRFAEADLSKSRYIFYTNISNDFTDEELKALQDRQQWLPVFSKRSGAVKVAVYERVSALGK